MLPSPRRLLGIALLASAAIARASSTYTVTVAEESPDVLHVEGTFRLETPTVGMSVTSSPQLEDGQAELVRNLRVYDSTGRRVSSDYLGQGDWSVPAGVAGDRVTIEYDIALEHDRYAWGPGIDEVAYRQDDGLFFTGFSLFIVPAGDPAGEVEVGFDLPSGWSASTPWERAGVTENSPEHGIYRARGFTDLTDNCLFLGRHVEELVSVDGFELILAVGSDLEAKKKLFVDTMAPLLPGYVEVFGGMPAAARFLVVINEGSRSDGGAFQGSYSLLIRGEVSPDTRVIWGHGIAHELAHFWNGQTITPAQPSDEEWFKEGFTDYLTLIQLSRSGLDSWEVTTRKLENMARRYAVARHLLGFGDSLVSAGSDKHRKRFLVYGGGALVALALDVRIREATDNRAGLDDLFRAMHQRFGATAEPYTTADVIDAASAVSGTDQRDFFARYVLGTEYLDITPTLDALGLRLTTMVDEFYISRRSDATPRQRSVATSVFGPAAEPAR